MKKDILVVDDELDQRDYLKALLEDHGYSVRTAADGLEAMQRVKEATPDLVLLDLVRRFLAGQRFGIGNIMASGVGAVTLR